MVRVTWQGFARRSVASGFGRTSFSALLLAACVSTGETTENPGESTEDPAIVVHDRTSEATDSRWAACIHEPTFVPGDIQLAVDALPSLPDCPHDMPLPCGACGDEGELCSAAVTRGCCGKPYAVNSAFPPLDGWVCRCEGGEYNCWISSPGASACVDCDAPRGTCAENNGECSEGCFDVEAAAFDVERGCVERTFESVGCSSIYEATSDTGCVRRVSDGAIFVAGSFTRHLQSDEWEPCSAEEIASTEVVCE